MPIRSVGRPLLVVLTVAALVLAVVPAARGDEVRLLLTGDSTVLLLSASGQAHHSIPTAGFVGGADFGPGGARVAYAVSGGLPYQTELRMADRDGTRDRSLLVLPVSGIQAIDWSPDGRWIAFLAVHGYTCWGCPPPWTLNLYDVANDLHVALGPASEIDWAPDSSRIAFVHVGGIHVMSVLAGAVPTRVTANEMLASAPSWSPDGGLIAYLSMNRDGPLTEPTVSVMRPDGSRRRDLGVKSFSNVSWAPDSRSVAAVRDDRHLTVVGLDGSMRTLQLSSGSTWALAWAPDGHEIAYLQQSDDGRTQAIRMIRADGSGDRRIHQDTRWLSGPLRWG